MTAMPISFDEICEILGVTQDGAILYIRNWKRFFTDFRRARQAVRAHLEEWASEPNPYADGGVIQVSQCFQWRIEVWQAGQWAYRIRNVETGVEEARGGGWRTQAEAKDRALKVMATIMAIS